MTKSMIQKVKFQTLISRERIYERDSPDYIKSMKTCLLNLIPLDEKKKSKKEFATDNTNNWKTSTQLNKMDLNKKNDN